MNDTSPPQKQPRIPGVRYTTETRHFQRTTTVDGKTSTRMVPYEVDVPVPPRDWDGVLLRGVTWVTFSGTVLTVAGSVAAIGGLLSMTIPAEVGYAVAAGFDLTWLAASALQYIEKDRPERASKAERASWFFLVVTMAAIVTYGIVLDHWEVGAIGATVPAMNKWLLSRLVDAYAVDLPEDLEHWMQDQTARGLVRAVAAQKLRRIDGHEAYMLAAFGPEAVARANSATDAVTVVAQVDEGQPVPAVSAPVSTPVLPAPQPPTPPTGQPVPVVSAPVSTPAPVAAPAPVQGQPVPPVSTPVPPVVPAVSTPVAGGTVSQIAPSITATVRQLLDARPELGERDDAHLAELIAETAKVHGDGGDPTKFSKTVRRLRGRILGDPPAPTRKTS